MIFADFDTPSGVQVCFSHDPYSRQSVGRVVSAKFAGGKMRGVVELSDADVRSAIAGGLASLDAGVNNGLSCGFNFLDFPPTKLEKGEGTQTSPTRSSTGASNCGRFRSPRSRA